MNLKRFAHQFFHFRQSQWTALWQKEEPSLAGLKRLFRDEPFPRRALKEGEVRSWENALRLFDQVQEAENRAGVRSLEPGQPGYPEALGKYIPPDRLPVFLHLRGQDPAREESMIALVGTRNPSALGMESAADFSACLSAHGIRVVSGLAKGVDAIAHRENLHCGTLAVLGSGVTDIYPAANCVLADRILEEGGTLLSPYPLGQVPLPRNFPRRNELIAALALGTVVIEGAEASGAAVTGKLALAMGKTVVALPQDFRTPFGRGAIRLHEAGAVLVASVEEALHALFSRAGGYSRQPDFFKTRQRSFTLEDFARASGKDLPDAVVLLEEGLALGRLERLAPNCYRVRERKSPADAKR